jgi:hypothetical protein
MTRRRIFAPLLLLPVAFAAPAGLSLRGKLRQREAAAPGLELSDGKLVRLSGDDPTIGVLNDPRLKDIEFEVVGRYAEQDRFDIDLIHTRSLFAYRGGKRLMVTYWCDICYIRTYTPGECWCCQEWTELDLRDPAAPERVP